MPKGIQPEEWKRKACWRNRVQPGRFGVSPRRWATAGCRAPAMQSAGWMRAPACRPRPRCPPAWSGPARCNNCCVDRWAAAVPWDRKQTYAPERLATQRAISMPHKSSPPAEAAERLLFQATGSSFSCAHRREGEGRALTATKPLSSFSILRCSHRTRGAAVRLPPGSSISMSSSSASTCASGCSTNAKESRCLKHVLSAVSRGCGGTRANPWATSLKFHGCHATTGDAMSMCGSAPTTWQQCHVGRTGC